MANGLPVSLKISAQDRASAVLGKIKDRLHNLNRAAAQTEEKFKGVRKRFESLDKVANKIGGGFKTVGRNMTGFISAPIALMGASMFRTAHDFQAAMNLVESKVTITGATMADLTKKALELGAKGPHGANKVAEAMAELAAVGYDSTKILGAIEPTLNLATAGKVELARSAEILTNIMNGFGLATDKASRTVDVLAKVSDASSVELEDLFETMKYLGPVAKDFGMSFEQMSAAVGVLGNNGLKGSIGATALKTALTRLSAPTEKVRQILGKDGLNLQIMDARTGKLREFTDIMGDLGKKLKGLPNSARLRLLKEIFEDQGMAGASILADAAINGQLGDMIGVLEKADGTAKKVSDTLMKGLPGELMKLKAAWQSFELALADTGVVTVFTDLIKAATGLIKQIGSLSPGLLKFGVVIAGIMMVMGPFLIVLGSLIQSFGMLRLAAPFVVKALAMIAPALTTVMSIFTGALFSVPGLIAAVVVGLILLAANWKTVTTKGKEYWEDFVLWLTGKFNILKRLGSDLADAFSRMWNGGPSTDGFKLPDQTQPNFYEPRASGGNFGPVRPINSTTTKREVSEQRVTIDFKNLPSGTKVRTDKSKTIDSLVLNSGMQGAS